MTESAPITPAFRPAGDSALVVEFGDRIDRELSRLVLALDARVKAAALPGVIETVPTFRSLMVHLDPLLTDVDDLERAIRSLTTDLTAADAPGHRPRPRCRCRRRLRNRVAERWCAVRVADFERRRVVKLREDLGHEYEAQIGLNRRTSKETSTTIYPALLDLDHSRNRCQPIILLSAQLA